MQWLLVCVTFEVRGSDIGCPGVIMIPAPIGDFSGNL